MAMPAPAASACFAFSPKAHAPLAITTMLPFETVAIGVQPSSGDASEGAIASPSLKMKPKGAKFAGPNNACAVPHNNGGDAGALLLSS